MSLYSSRPITPDQLHPSDAKSHGDRNTGCSLPASEEKQQQKINDDAALLQFSSGTTGIKRGVLLSDRAVLEQLLAYSTAIGLSRDDRIVGWLPLYHDMGFMTSLNMPLVLGVHSIMMQPLDWVANPGMYLKAVSDYRATLGWHPNFAYSFMSQRVRDDDLEGLDLSSLRGLANCSEPVTKDSQDRFRERFAPSGLGKDVFWGCYAMAETAFALTHGTCADSGYLDGEGPTDAWSRDTSAAFVSVGRPIHGVELIVADEHGQPLADRRLGELLAKSPFNLTGYYNNPEATTNAFSADWYRTGDLGFRVGSEFYVCGRKKDLLIVGGVNLYPQDVEELVSQIPGIQPGRVAVFSVFDSRAQTERVVVLAEADIPVSEKMTLIVAVRQRILACFQIANFDVELISPGWLIKSSSGKMARGANRDKWLLNGGHKPAGFKLPNRPAYAGWHGQPFSVVRVPTGTRGRPLTLTKAREPI